MIAPSDLRLAVMTVNRSPEYIHTTLASLLLSGPFVHCLKGLHLVVGGGEAGYLEHYRHNRRVEVHIPGEQDCRRLREWTPHQRFCFNYYRCLAVVPADCHGIVICEDDVIFQDRFLETAINAINELEERGVSKYLLDMYIPDSMKPRGESGEGKYCVKYDVEGYYGTQCIFFPRTVVPEVAWMMQRFGVAEYRAPGDMIVKQYAGMTDTLYGTRHSLVQHIGVCSTGLSSFTHCAPTFNQGSAP